MRAKKKKFENRLLVIDDDRSFLDMIEDVASSKGYGVQCSDNAEDFRSLLVSFDPTVIFLDLIMPETDGIEILRELAEQDCKSKIVMMSGMDSKVLATARRLGDNHGLTMIGVLEKPINLEDLEQKLDDGWRDSLAVTAADLEAAIEGGEIQPYFQPKVTLREDGGVPIHGAEALVRWQHPDRGLLSPAFFLGVAEKSGLIDAMTDRVMEAAIAQLKDLHDRDLNVSVAVNLAPQLLTDLKLPDKIVERLGKFGKLTDCFALEITESAAMGEGANTLDILTRFRVKNIGLSMDDFGTGYSSLVELYRLPFSELKVDRSFVTDIDKSEEARIIVRSLVDLARNLGLSTCAEGVETASALDFLRSVGCDKAQGFLISKPLPGNEFLSFVETWDEMRYAKKAKSANTG